MKKVILGKTGIEVTELCYGALPMGPLQKNLPVGEGADVIAHALESGVTFIDTAQMYRTYPMIRKALDKTGKRPVISTKSAAAGYDDMEQAVHEAIDALGYDTLDIFFLHAARVGADLFEQRAGAWQCLKDYREKGKIKAIGISTHNVKTVLAAAGRDDVDVIFPLINKAGMGILEGTRDDMEAAIERAFEKNIGVLIMKLLAGGAILSDYKEAVDYVRGFVSGRAASALGMIHKSEVDMNVKYFSGEPIDEYMPQISGKTKEFFVFQALCKSCGRCAKGCHSNAIAMDVKAQIDPEKCLRCGYCVAECPEFAIRMV